MRALIAILGHTPLWVYAVLAVLVVLGVQALRARTLPLWRLLAVPVLFAGWGALSIALRALDAPAAGLAWLVFGVAGAAIARATAATDQLRIARAGGTVEVPGSALPLVRNIIVFIAKYILSVAIILAPAERGTLYLGDAAVAGLMFGYFACWVLLVLRKYLTTTVQPAA